MQQEGAGREALRAVAAVLGIPVTVTDDEQWQLDSHGLCVGLGWYSRRGHSPAEAAALTLLQLWEGVRGPRLAPERLARVQLLNAAHPELAPLLSAISRAQAAAEVMAVFPGLRGAMLAALHRGLPGAHAAQGLSTESLSAQSLSTQSRGDQWLALVLLAGFGADLSFYFPNDIKASSAISFARTADDANAATTTPLEPHVCEEWTRAGTFAGARGDGVWRVLRTDPDRAALDRFERAVALLAPGYERLLALDAAEHGLSVGGTGPRGSEEQAPEPGAADSLPGEGPPDDGNGAEEGADPEQRDSWETPAADEEPPDQERPGDGSEHAEGSNLFQSEQTGSVTAFLDTPLPAAGALAAAFAQVDTDQHQPNQATSHADPAQSAGHSPGAPDAQYTGRVAALGTSIERMRGVWHEVTAERVATVTGMGRHAQVEGEALDQASLATGLAQTWAGVPRPRMFLQREHRQRRARRSGSTDYVLLIDRSASMQGRPAQAAADTAVVMLEGIAAAARDIAQAEAASGLDLELQLRTSLIVFDSRAHLVKPLSSGMSDDVRERLLAAISEPQGSTNDAAALAAAFEQLRGSAGSARGAAVAGGDARERRRIVFVISDGGTNDVIAATHGLRSLRAMGVEVWGIGLGSDDLTERYRPHGSRVDRPELLPDAIRELIRQSLPR